MDDWLQTLLGTVIIGGVVAIASTQARKQGYNEAMETLAKNAQEQEILNLKAEINALKEQKILN